MTPQHGSRALPTGSPLLRGELRLTDLDPASRRRCRPSPHAPDDPDAIWHLLNTLALTLRPDRAAFDLTLGEMLARPDMLVLVAEASGLGVVGYLVASFARCFRKKLDGSAG